MRKLSAVAAASLAALGAAAAPAGGQVPERDPSAESPTGHVYQLPVDSARGDAAPRQPPGGDSRSAPVDPGARPRPPADGGGAPAVDGVPGASGDGARAGDAHRPPSAIRSENGFGTSARVPGVDTPASARRPAAELPSDPSGARAFGLLALGVLLAAGAGLASRSGRRRT